MNPDNEKWATLKRWVMAHKFVVFGLPVIALGLLAGYRLSQLPHLESYKLLNVIGLFYDLLAVVALSELAARSEKWKMVAVNHVAPAVMWLHTLFPAGGILGGVMAMVFRLPSAAKVATFAMGFGSYSILPLTVLEWTVALPRFQCLKHLDSRWRWFGVWLLFNGVLVQLIAAVLALKTS